MYINTFYQYDRSDARDAWQNNIANECDTHIVVYVTKIISRRLISFFSKKSSDIIYYSPDVSVSSSLWCIIIHAAGTCDIRGIRHNNVRNKY